MSQHCVVTFTWMIMGHGICLRYATDKSILNQEPNQSLATKNLERGETRFIPDFDPTEPFEKKNFHDNTNYIALSKPEWLATSDAGNGWQAHELTFKDIFGISADRQDKIERKIQIIENICHKSDGTTWSIFQNLIPWEKAITGYKDQNEKKFLEELFGLITRGNKNYNFNYAWDPNVGIRPIGGGFCRLMLINITNETDEEEKRRIKNNEDYGPDHILFKKCPNKNYYYGDKTEFGVDGYDDEYGFEIPSHQLFLSEIGEKCWQNSQRIFETDKHKLGYLGNNCKLRMCIYDGTCNDYRRWITPNIQELTKQYFLKKKKDAIMELVQNTPGDLSSGGKIGGNGGGNGGNITEEIADLERILNEQSESMKETKVDPYNVSLNIILDLKEIAEDEKEGSDKSSSS